MTGTDTKPDRLVFLSPAPQLELTILMPCLNESETIGRCIGKANDWLTRNQVKGEVLVSDNGSTDGSQRIAIESGARVIHAPEKGYGAALIAGIMHARGTYVIMGDSDDSYDFSSLDRFLDKLREGYDLVMGNRFKGGIEKGAMPFLHRYFGTPALSFIVRIFFKARIGDIQCGLRGFRRNIISRLDLQTMGMEFASEMIVKASLFQLRITEVPTTLAIDGRNRRPHLRTWRDGWRNLRFYLMHSPKWLFYIPGVSLFFIGLLLMLLTAAGRFEIMQGVYFDVSTLVFAGVFMITGFSCITLGLFTRTYATEEGFLPRNKLDSRIEKFFTLESGIATGLVILLCGVAGSVFAFYTWQQARFGNLDYPGILRIVVPSATLILLGTQLLFSSFFLGILKIRRRTTSRHKEST